MFEKLIKLSLDKKINLDIIKSGDEFYTRFDIKTNVLHINVPERDDFIIDDNMIYEIIETIL